MSGQVGFQIRFRIAKRLPVLLEECMDLEAGLEPEEASDLRLAQGSRPVAFDGQGFQSVARHVSPLPGE